MAQNYPILFALLRAKAHERHISITTSGLASALGVSQQTASRWLIKLRKDELAEKNESGIRLTKKALLELRSLSDFLLISLDSKKSMRLKGRVIHGVGDGKYYLSLPGYSRQFKKKLGFLPFPGTLNIEIEDMEAKLNLADRPGLSIGGFPHQGRTLGDIRCFPCSIGKRAKGFVILPARSHHGLNVLEVISEHNLRKRLKLKDGDSVEIRVALE